MSKVIAGLLLGFWLVGLPLIGQAATNSGVASLRVRANLAKDGTVKVEQAINFINPSSLSWRIFTSLKNPSLKADGQTLSRKDWQVKNVGHQKSVQSPVVAKQWLVSYDTTTTFLRQQDRDQFYLKVLQEPGRQVFDVSVQLVLPAEIDPTTIDGNVYAISGIEKAVTAVKPPNAIVYTTAFAGPKSVFTISASWPKSLLNLSRFQEIRLSLLNFAVLPWLVLGLVVPIISLVILLSLAAHEKKNEQPVRAVVGEPPAALSPILAGVLVSRKIYPKDLVALLVDLCQRGYLVLVKKGGQYYLSQRRVADEHLQIWEREVLDQLFASLGVKVTETKLKALNNQSFFSPKIKAAFAQIYGVITELHFFRENPHLTRIRYKLIALIFYFTALVGIIWTVATGDSPYLLIPLTGSLILSYLIIRLSPQLIHYSPEGLQAKTQWLAFGNFLGLAEPVPFEAAQNHYFEKYLAYAIALNKTREWAKRFDRGSTVITQPDWFLTYEEMTAQELAKELVTFTEVISEQLTKLRGPLVN